MYSLDAESIKRHWLPYGHATIDSIAVDGKDAWFYFSNYAEKHLGRITMDQTPPEFHEYDLDIRLPLFVGPPDVTLKLSREARMEAMLKERWTDITQGIAAKGGNVWYGEAEERWHLEEPDKSLTAHSEPVSWAICRIEADTGEITKYVFPEPDMTPRSHVGYRICTDLKGRTLSGATYANSVWIFDTTSRRLKRFVLGGIVEDRIKHPDGSEQVVRQPELWLKDLVMDSDGKRCWAIDPAGPRSEGALYELKVNEESILRHALPRPPRGPGSIYRDGVRKMRPRALSLSPDGKVWFTCDAEWTAASPEERRTHPYPIQEGFVISFDPRSFEMTSYRSAEQPTSLEGILVTLHRCVWYGFRHQNRWGLRSLNDDMGGESVQSQPEEIKAVQILDGEATEVDGGEAMCRRLDLLKEPPVRRRIQKGSSGLELGGDSGMVRKLAEDSEGRIWFSTWGAGYVGVLAPKDT